MTSSKQTLIAMLALIAALLIGYVAGVPATVTVTLQPDAVDAVDAVALADDASVTAADDATAATLPAAVTP